MNLLIRVLYLSGLSITFISCSTKSNKGTVKAQEGNIKYPSEVMPSLDQWSILLGNGERIRELKNFQHKDYFYTEHNESDWVVYKAPNGALPRPIRIIQGRN